MSEYAFDIRLMATVRVNATTERAARALVRAHLGAADVNAGAWPNGDPILFEAFADDDLDLLEVDGVEVE